jgi:hypothetical protein
MAGPQRSSDATSEGPEREAAVEARHRLSKVYRPQSAGLKGISGSRSVPSASAIRLM